MSGRGPPQQPMPVQPPTRPTGQGNHPPQNQSGRTAAPGAADGAPAMADVNRQQPQGRWGDHGVNAYGDCPHRGSSSSGGGCGYAWQGNGGGGNGFTGPPGKRGGFRPNWGGKGGGRKPKPPLPPQDLLVEKEDENLREPNKLGPAKEAVKDPNQLQGQGTGVDPNQNTALQGHRSCSSFPGTRYDWAMVRWYMMASSSLLSRVLRPYCKSQSSSNVW
ncbi:hypothetical protein ZWY2020_031914 [Hordeum vulgare]|nr:hypothetical protein ZWY2020_031914 [Hordeum vulgare]